MVKAMDSPELEHIEQARLRLAAALDAARREPLIAGILRRLQDQLSPVYTYHSLGHTQDVLGLVVLFSLADSLPERESHLLARRA